MLFYIIDAIIWLLLSGLYIILYYRRFNNALKNKSIRLYRVTPKAFVIVLTLITLIASGTNLIVSGQDEHISMIDYEIDEYTVNNYNDASMVILDDSVSKAGLSLEIHYYGEDEGTYSSWFTIYVYQDNAWNKLDYISEEIPLWTMIGYRVEKKVLCDRAVVLRDGKITGVAGKHSHVKTFNIVSQRKGIACLGHVAHQIILQ